MVLRTVAADSAVTADLARLQVFDPEQLESLTGIVLDLLLDPKTHSFEERIGAFSQAHNVAVRDLQAFVRALLVMFKAALQQGLSPEHIVDDLVQLGVPEGKASAMHKPWQERHQSLKPALAGREIRPDKLVDCEWRFGVTAATDEQQQVGSVFLQLKLAVECGSSQRQDELMELSLADFYRFLANMEKAKSYMDFISP